MAVGADLIFYSTRIALRHKGVPKSYEECLEDVRNQVANLNTFVQERITGMKIVQIFVREKPNMTPLSRSIGAQRAWIRTVWYNSIFFPIAEISGSVALGLIVWYGGMNVMPAGVIDDSGLTLGLITAFVQLSQMLFRPLRMIADKFNTLQMGMVAANRVFGILDTEANLPDTGLQAPKEISGNIDFQRFIWV